MRRVISSSLLSLLMTATLLWGGCVACPQFFMFPNAKKSCCNLKAGKCEPSGKSAPQKQCKRMPLEPTGLAQIAAEPPLAAVHQIEPASIPVAREPALSEYSPPELHLLHSTFLI